MWTKGWRAAFVATAVALQSVVLQVAVDHRGAWYVVGRHEPAHGAVRLDGARHLRCGRGVRLCRVMATTLAFPPSLPEMSETKQS